MTQPVYVAVIEFRNGDTVTVHRTREGALAEVTQWAMDNWMDEMPSDAVMPDTDEAIRDEYFAFVDDEFYSVTESSLVD